MKKQFTLERWTHGWVLCSAPPVPGIPMDALGKVAPLAGKNAVIDPGIGNHLTRSRKSENAVFVFGQPSDLEAWRKEIQQQLNQIKEPGLRWLWGLDVGQSATAIFRALRQPVVPDPGNVPHDAADFGRCSRLVTAMNWRDRLPEVAAAYPSTRWPAIIARWDELCGLDATGQCKLLREIGETILQAT